MKLRKGDEIVISAGKDKGKKGKIERIFPSKNKVLIPGLNVYKKHMKKRDEQNPGGIISFSRPFPVSNVSLLCPKCGKPTRVGYKIEKNSAKGRSSPGRKKVRICRKCQSQI